MSFWRFAAGGEARIFQLFNISDSGQAGMTEYKGFA
jgi:hypothetical protein